MRDLPGGRPPPPYGGMMVEKAGGHLSAGLSLLGLPSVSARARALSRGFRTALSGPVASLPSSLRRAVPREGIGPPPGGCRPTALCPAPGRDVLSRSGGGRGQGTRRPYPVRDRAGGASRPGPVPFLPPPGLRDEKRPADRIGGPLEGGCLSAGLMAYLKKVGMSGRPSSWVRISISGMRLRSFWLLRKKK